MLIADEWLQDLPQQFQSKKNIEVLINAFAKQMQGINQVFEDLNTMTDLDTASGTNLDYVGTIIPLTRKEAGELAGVGVTDPVISDERYRQFLRYKNLVNTNECTYYDLINGIELLWKYTGMRYIEEPEHPATVVFQTDTMGIDEPDLLEFHTNLCIRAAGVGLILRKMYHSYFEVPIQITVPALYIHSEFSRYTHLYLDGTYLLDGTYDLSGYADAWAGYSLVSLNVTSGFEIQTRAESIYGAVCAVIVDINTDISLQTQMDVKTDIRTEHGFRVSSGINIDTDTDADLTIEKDLWYLDGIYRLDDEKLLDAEIIIAEME